MIHVLNCIIIKSPLNDVSNWEKPIIILVEEVGVKTDDVSEIVNKCSKINITSRPIYQISLYLSTTSSSTEKLAHFCGNAVLKSCPQKIYYL